MPISLPNRVHVEHLDDPRLAPFRNVKDRDLAAADTFLAESEVVLRVLVRRRTHPLVSVLVSESRVEKLAELLVDVPVDVPIFTARQPVLDAVTGLHFHRGVLACARRTPVPDAARLLSTLPAGPATVVLLEGLTNHDNVGSIFRNAAALGANGVLLDELTCDPLYRKAIRVSVGGCLVVPYSRGGRVLDALPALREAGFVVLALTPNEPALELTELRKHRPQRVALLLGSEGPGLTDTTLSEADIRVRIRQENSFDSLNVATASGIALHELANSAS